MRMRYPWWRPLSGGAVAVLWSALLAGASAASAATPAAASTRVAGTRVTGGTWGTAKELPGLAALNKGGHGVVDSVSCPSAGNCGAAGIYADGAGHVQVFVAN